MRSQLWLGAAQTSALRLFQLIGDGMLLQVSPPYVTVHDWFVRHGEWAIGIEECDYYTFAPKGMSGAPAPTTVYLGRTYVATAVPAFGVLAIALIAVVVLIGAVSFVIARVGRRQPRG